MCFPGMRVSRTHIPRDASQEIANAISIPIDRLLNSVYPGLFGQVQIRVTQEFDFRITSDVGQIYFGLTRLLVCYSSLMQ